MKIWTVYFRSYWSYKNAFIWTKFVININNDWSSDFGLSSNINEESPACDLINTQNHLFLPLFSSSSCPKYYFLWNWDVEYRIIQHRTGCTSLQEGEGPRFGEKPLKTTENLALDPPICPLFHRSWPTLPPFFLAIFFHTFLNIILVSNDHKSTNSFSLYWFLYQFVPFYYQAIFTIYYKIR